jgi:DNA-binding CsgD family transcriptional regulator/tetratricopeptide (TPR) repeat protein
VEEQAGAARYRLLETIRQYGRERLDDAGEAAALRRRHRDYYLRLAERADANSTGPKQSEWAERLRIERPNLFAALDYCLTVPGEATQGLLLGSNMWYYWTACGFVRDGRYWLDRALKADRTPSRVRARALWIDALAALMQGELGDAMALAQESHDLAKSLDDAVALTHAIQKMGAIETVRNDLPRAVELLDEALARFRERGSWTAPALIVFSQRMRAAVMMGDTDRAVDLGAEGDAICSRLGERWARSWILNHLGLVWWVAGDHRKARAQLREALRLKLELRGDQVGIPYCIELLSWVTMAEGDPGAAAVLFGAAEKLWEPIGPPLFGYQVLLGWRDENRAAMRATLGDRAFDAACQQGAGLTPDALAAVALGREPPASTSVRPAGSPVLTKREHEVAELIARGLRNREIAAELVISQRTAEAHVEHILAKLGFTSRSQVAAWLGREGYAKKT